MISLYIWKILGIIAIILLIAYRKERNAVWGGITLGIIIGFIIATFFAIRGEGFNWLILIKSSIVGIIFGFMSELLGKIGSLIKK